MKYNPVKLILSIFVSLIYSACLLAISYFLKDYTIMLILFIISLVTLAIFSVINIVKTVRIKNNNIKNINIYEIYEEQIKYMEEINDVESSHNKLKKKLKNSFIYIWVVFAISSLFSLSLFSINDVEGIIPFTLIAFSIIFDIIASFIGYKTPTNKNMLINHDNHPYIDKIVLECKQELNIEKKIYVCVEYSDDVRINKIDNTFYLYIGLGILNSVSENELKHILYHEIAHVINEDVDLSYSICSKANKIQSLYSILLFSFISKAIEKETSMFIHFVQLEEEKKADSIILEKGDRQFYVNALAKVCLFSFQDDYRFTMNIYEFEETPKNYIEYYLKKRIENYENNKEMYLTFLNNAIERKFDTHPCFKKRMASLGIKLFNIDFDFERSEEYQKEIELLNAKYNKEWYDLQNKNWEQNHNLSYLFYLNHYNELKNKAIEEMSDDELLKYAYCVIIFETKQQAIKIYDKVLEKNPNNAYAIMQRGYTKYAVNDLTCIEDFEKAGEMNPNVLGETSFLIGTILNNNGREDLIEEYRKNHLKKIEKVIDNQKFFVKKKNKVFEKADLDNEIIDKIQNKINDENKIVKAYILKHYLSEESSQYLVCLKFNRKEKIEETTKIVNDFFIYLQGIGSLRFEVIDVTYNPYINSNAKRLKVDYLKK